LKQRQELQKTLADMEERKGQYSAKEIKKQEEEIKKIKDTDRIERRKEVNEYKIAQAQASLQGKVGKLFSNIVRNPILGKFGMFYKRQLRIWIRLRETNVAAVTLIGIIGFASIRYMFWGWDKSVKGINKMNAAVDSSEEPLDSSGPAIFNATTGLWVDSNTGAVRTPPRLYSGADLSWYVPFTNKTMAFTDTMPSTEKV